MRDPEALLSIIAEIYTLPGDPSRWPGVLEHIGERVGAHAGGYLVIDPLDYSTSIGGQWGFNEVHTAAYEGMQGPAKDVRFKYFHRLVPGEVLMDFEHVPDRAEYESNAWIRYERETLGIYWYMVSLISRHGLWHDIITINRLHERGPYGEEDRADLKAMLPHLARAAELHRAVSGLEDRYGAVLAVLDKLLVGVVILDRHQRVVIANRTARRACETTGALRITPPGRLEAWQAEKNARLQALLAATADTAEAEGRDAGSTLVLSHRAVPGGLLAEVLPLRDDGFPDGERLRGSVVFLVDPHQARLASVDWMARLFRLTAAEHAVAAQLINGADTWEIAETRGKSVQTIRTQLKSVFAKTGAKSQLELVRLALKANPPIESAQPEPRKRTTLPQHSADGGDFTASKQSRAD